MFGWTIVGILLIAACGWVGARRAARGMAALHSLPVYHGLYVALWSGLPALLLAVVWVAAQGPVVDRMTLAALPPAFVAGADAGALQLLLSEIKSVAAGRIFAEPAAEIVAAAERWRGWRQLAGAAMFATGLALALAGLLLARRRLSAAFRARPRVERIFTVLMVCCSTAAVLTTLGIVLSLVFEALHFFQLVSWREFFFGLNWEPQMPIRADQVAGVGAFGALPVFAGTLLIAAIALAVAVPVGLFSAIYLSEYAAPRTRATMKPILELLAGVPTVVYGFFAVLTVAPALRSAGALLGFDIAPNSALAAGAVMGIMIIPFVSSLSDDAISAVPQSLREGAYGLGATQAETIRSVLLPAALPGIVGGILLAASRAIGETMIVVMAAGLIANLTANPLEAVTTVTLQIVALLTGDTAFDSPKTLAAFALGLVLFVLTLCLNVIALQIVKKYRERYE